MKSTNTKEMTHVKKHIYKNIPSKNKKMSQPNINRLKKLLDELDGKISFIDSNKIQMTDTENLYIDMFVMNIEGLISNLDKSIITNGQIKHSNIEIEF